MTQATCPECGTTFPAEGAAELTCPACFAAFSLEAPDRWARVALRSPDGRELGVFERYAVRERIYLGRLKGREAVRPASGGEWVELASRPEFAEVLALVGVDVGAGQIARQSLKGWRKTGSAVGARRRRVATPSMTGAARTASAEASPASEAPADRRGLALAAVALAALALIALALIALS